MKQSREKPVCMICSSAEHVLRRGGVCLCGRCLEALGEALAEKLGYSAENSQKDPPSRP